MQCEPFLFILTFCSRWSLNEVKCYASKGEKIWVKMIVALSRYCLMQLRYGQNWATNVCLCDPKSSPLDVCHNPTPRKFYFLMNSMYPSMLCKHRNTPHQEAFVLSWVFRFRILRYSICHSSWEWVTSW